MKHFVSNTVRRITALLMALLMVVTLLPATAAAAVADDVPFRFTLDGEVLEMNDAGTYQGDPCYEVQVPAGTETVQVERDKSIQISSYGYSILFTYGTSTVDLKIPSFEKSKGVYMIYSGNWNYVYFVETEEEIPAGQPVMEITDDALSANEYETYYYADGITYTYNGKVVTFISESQFQAGGATYNLKNKKTEVAVENDGEGNIEVSLTNLSAPVFQISGEWNSSYGGTIQAVYQTDIPGMEEVRSASLSSAISLSGVPEGTWHLTGGTIYEKANQWSPGHDFGDGNGVVTEAYFGTLPDIVLTVEADPEPGPEAAVEAAIQALPATEELTLRDKAAVEQARDLYDALTEAEQAKVTSYSVLTDAETKIEELMEIPFLVAIDGELLEMTSKGENDWGDLLVEVTVPAGTKTVQLERYASIQVQNSSYQVIHQADATTVDLENIAYGESNGFNLSYNVTNYFCLYFVEEQTEEDAYLGVKTEAKVYDDFENDIWLQYQQRDMQVGDTASLYPWRVAQIVSNVITNDVQRPTFHFEIISGDSVSLDVTESDQKATVTAVKPGTSVVKVTYDAKDYNGLHWDAISDVNTAYAVYTVGETGTATITVNDELANWHHYDTIYYNEGETVPYSFTVDTEGAEKVKVTLNGLEIQGSGNEYTANLENRSNIIGIQAWDGDGNVKSLYRVVDARFIEVNVANKTRPGETLLAGDTANISFRGITMPVYKLATIYNPQMGTNATRVEYSNEALGDFVGKCSQWDLATNNDFDVTFEEAGEYTFHSEKGIFCAWWGSNLGADITAEGSGEPNLNAPTLQDYFSFLPDFTVKVEAAVEVTSVALDQSSLTLDLNETAQLTATVLPENATYRDVTWASSDSEVAAVENGLVTAKKAGTAEITATAGEVSATCTVLVKGSTPEEVNAAIQAIPAVDDLTLRDKAAVDEARLLYDNLSEEDQAKVTAYDHLTDAEAKIEELLGTPFLFSLNGRILEMKNTGEANAYRGYYYEVKVPAGTTTVQLERYKNIKVQDQSYTTLIEEDTTTVDVENISLGKSSYIILNYDTFTYDYIYFVEEEAGGDLYVSVEPGVINPGAQVTVSIPDLQDPETEGEVRELQTIYETDIPGLSTVSSQQASGNAEQIKTITFTVPEDTEAGTYHLTNGYVYKKWGGYYVQGIFLVGVEEQRFYEGQMPEIEIEVVYTDEQAAARVMDMIDALGTITCLKQEEEVQAARDAYEALTAGQKTLVTNLETLEAAEMALDKYREGGTITLSIERFTLGQGFYMEPVQVEFEAGETLADVLERLLGDDLVNPEGNYVSGIYGADLGSDSVQVPDYISEYLDGPTTEEALEVGNSDDVLGEFDYWQGSGWYYFYNNIVADHGVGYHGLQDGEVVRFQFTLLYGSDLTGTVYGEDAPRVEISNKDEAIILLAKINGREDKDELLGNDNFAAAYEKLYGIVQDAVAGQDEVDAAIQGLRDALEAAQRLPGDYNGDGVVDSWDAVDLLGDLNAGESIDLGIGDINSDGTVDSWDAVDLLKQVNANA